MTSAVRFGICLLVGMLIWILPVPAGVEPTGWQVFAVFVATIVGFLVRPLPMGPVVLLALILLASVQSLTFKEALSGFGDTTVWLVVAAFLIAGSVTRTGMGRRIALILISRLGKTMLGLGYASCAAEMTLGAFIPSNTARGGGIMAPIMNSLAQALDSYPDRQPERAGIYLMLVGAHANLIAAATFLTGMAANPLVSVAARDVFGVEFGWLTWFIGAMVPALIGIGLLPVLIKRLVRPRLQDARAAQMQSIEALNELGPWSRPELIMAGVFVLLLTLWISQPLHGLATGLVALIGVGILILTGVDSWSDITENKAAWDTLIWLGGLLSMAEALKEKGVIDWFAASVQGYTVGLDGLAVALVLAVVYFYSMYGFSMLTGHIAAMVAAFMAVALAAGTPPLLMVALLAYTSNLCGCTTNYSTGPIIIYFGLGYVPVATWFRVGFIVSLFHLIVWLGAGLVWWKVLGWW